MTYRMSRRKSPAIRAVFTWTRTVSSISRMLSGLRDAHQQPMTDRAPNLDLADDRHPGGQRAVKSVEPVTALHAAAISVAAWSRSTRLTISLGECM